VDDDDDLRESLAEILEHAGYETVTAPNGEVAVELLLADDARPSLVVLDLHLPVLDGRELLTILRMHPATAKIPVIVVTSDSSPADLAYRIDGFFRKPVQVEALLGRIGELVAPARSL
jgi:CheY-like chemotaxis protein